MEKFQCSGTPPDSQARSGNHQSNRIHWHRRGTKNAENDELVQLFAIDLTDSDPIQASWMGSGFRFSSLSSWPHSPYPGEPDGVLKSVKLFPFSCTGFLFSSAAFVPLRCHVLLLTEVSVKPEKRYRGGRVRRGEESISSGAGWNDPGGIVPHPPP